MRIILSLTPAVGFLPPRALLCWHRPPHVCYQRPMYRVPAGFIEPCLPIPVAKPPVSLNWIHEVKHDGFRMIVRRDAAGVRLFTRKGNDRTTRFPLKRSPVSVEA